jgi:transposase-like protein
MKHKWKRREAIVAEYLTGDSSLRGLGAKYGYGATTIYRWVKEAERKKLVREGREPIGGDIVLEGRPGETAEEEIKRLRRELREAQLHTKLLNAMIDIAEEDLGVPIRKKSGSGQ